MNLDIGMVLPLAAVAVQAVLTWYRASETERHVDKLTSRVEELERFQASQETRNEQCSDSLTEIRRKVFNGGGR